MCEASREFKVVKRGCSKLTRTQYNDDCKRNQLGVLTYNGQSLLWQTERRETSGEGSNKRKERKQYALLGSLEKYHEAVSA